MDRDYKGDSARKLYPTMNLMDAFTECLFKYSIFAEVGGFLRPSLKKNYCFKCTMSYLSDIQSKHMLIPWAVYLLWVHIIKYEVHFVFLSLPRELHMYSKFSFFSLQ